MTRLVLNIVAGIASIFLATKFVPGVSLKIIPDQSSLFGIQFTAFWQILILTGTTLGLANFFIRPLLKIITLPLRLLTLGLFSFVINILMIWLVDILFLELDIKGLIPLFWTSVIVWGVSLLLGAYQKVKK